MPLEFEWDNKKNGANKRKHRISFEEASTGFADPLSSTIPDVAHSLEEDRFVILGESSRRRLLVVAFTERFQKVSIISARRATARERSEYEEGN